MLVFGHKYLINEQFYSVNSVEEIEKTPSNSTIFCKFSEKNISILQFAIDNVVDVAIEVESLKDAIFSEIFKVNFIIAKDLELAQELQKIAEHYMFDSKILTWIDSEDEISKVAKIGIDGVIFHSHICIAIAKKN
jgi:hypothetical protein